MSKLDQLKALGDAKRASRQNSRGDGESRPVGGRAKSQSAGKVPGPSLSDGVLHVGSKPTTISPEVAPGLRETKSKNIPYDSAEFLKTPQAIQHYKDEAIASRDHKFIKHARSTVAKAKVILRKTKSKGGRPLAKDADKALMKTKPWLAEGMSRASWYRRRKERSK